MPQACDKVAVKERFGYHTRIFVYACVSNVHNLFHSICSVYSQIKQQASATR